MSKNINTQWFGVILGMFFPLIGVFVYYLIASLDISFRLFLISVFEMNLVSKVLSLGLLANLIIFLIFFNLHKDRIARGIIIATFFYAFVILIFRFFV